MNHIVHNYSMALGVWLVWGACATLAQAPREIPPAFGPHVGLSDKDFAEARSFKAEDRIVGTYYFYWYDSERREHITDGDGSDALTTHPPTLEGLSYRSTAWHRDQLRDMIAAGIDVVLPVFWGAPSEQGRGAHLHWSYEGIGPLIETRQQLLDAGEHPPRIGLFYDTSTLQHNSWHEHVDLRTERGRQWFYATVRDFFSMVPPKHWAMIEGRPIVLLYSASFARGHDQRMVESTGRWFAEQFGGRRPWIAVESSWRVQADSVVTWGGALGLKWTGGVAALGPGYDHSAVPGRQPLIVDREGGAFYERQWLALLRRPVNFVMVETWNEWHEGTDVAESREYGRQYIELTRKYAELFKARWRPPRPAGPYNDAASVSIELGETNRSHGLRLVENDDGVTAAATVGGRPGRAAVAGASATRYMYFAVDESFKPLDADDITLRIDYYDDAPGTLTVQYDGSDLTAPFGGAYSPSPDHVTLVGSKSWKTASFRLPKARLLNRQNQQADLRLMVMAQSFTVGRVVLER